MTRLDDDVQSGIRQFFEQEELLQQQRETRLYELVLGYVYNTTQRQPGGFDRETASLWLRNTEYHQSFHDYGDPNLKKMRVKTHIGELLKLANGDRQLLEMCFDRALESLMPIPTKRFCWKVRVAKSKHLDVTTVLMRWGIRPKQKLDYVFISATATRVKRAVGRTALTSGGAISSP